jgi:hypothetical protein
LLTFDITVTPKGIKNTNNIKFSKLKLTFKNT